MPQMKVPCVVRRETITETFDEAGRPVTKFDYDQLDLPLEATGDCFGDVRRNLKAQLREHCNRLGLIIRNITVNKQMAVVVLRSREQGTKGVVPRGWIWRKPPATTKQPGEI